jgi:alpha-1,6-mannosyltransferase
VLVEALASGTPLVVPNAGAAAHVGSREASVLFDHDATPERIAEAVLEAVRRGSVARLAATRAAAEHPSTEAHFQMLFQLYEDLHRRTGRPRRFGVAP